jgi:hypothetical protein
VANVKCILFFSLSLLLMSCSTPQFRRIEVSIPVAQGYALSVSASGYISRSKNRLSVYLKTVTFTRLEQDWGSANPEFIEGLQVGLAVLGAEDWKTSIWGGMLHINKPIAAGETLVLGDFHTSIPLDGLDDVAEFDLMPKTDRVNQAGYSAPMFSRSTPVQWADID